MKYYFPPQNQSYQWLQTNHSDDFGSLWSTFNLDLQSNLGVIRLSQKLVTNTTTTDSANLGLPVAFEYFDDRWWAICGTYIYRNTSELLTGSFSVDNSKYSVGSSTSQFDITRPGTPNVNTTRYTYDGTGTDPDIDSSSFPIGASVEIDAQNFAAGNKGTFTVTGSGNNYFEVTNATGTAESNKTIGTGFIAVYGGSIGTDFDTENSDLAIFNKRLWATSESKLYSYDTGDNIWIERDSMTINVHQMNYFKKFNRLYFIDNSDTVSSIDTSDVVANSAGDYYLDLDNNRLDLTSMVSNSQYIWLGTKRGTGTDGEGTKGAVFQWDGISAQPTNQYELPTAGILAMVVHNDIPYAVDTEGRILKYTGYSFEEIQRFPILGILLEDSTESGQPPVHFNGFIATKDNTLLVAVNNLNDDNSATVNENLPSGVWELDLNTLNFTHRYSFTLKSRSSSTITDYGQNRISAIGALKMNTLAPSSSLGRSQMFAGSTYFTDASTTVSGIFITSPYAMATNTEGQKRGYFVTTWFNSNEIQDKFSRLWTVYRRFLTSTDKIVCKYRLNEEEAVLATITWTSTTTFTTTTDVSAYAPTVSPFNGTTGGEVEILQGTGSGSCTHITSVVNNAGTYTVTLDTAVTGVTGTAKARFQKWVKIFPEATGQVLSYTQMAIGDSNTRCQIKVCMEFTGDDEFHKFVLTSNSDIEAKL